jgi:spore coat polysaccharide biosynthesis protein SpsF
MRIVASIESRMGSTRLPGKALVDINGKSAIGRLVERLKKCEKLDEIIIATSTSSTDDVLSEWAKNEGVLCYRGDEEDVLQRVVDAHESINSDLIVEITGDSILSDPSIIDMGIDTYLANDCDVVTNCGNELSYPMGIYVQVFKYLDLKYISDTINDPAVREHVSLYFYENTDQYRVINLIAPSLWNAPQYRFQLDYEEDLLFINEIYKRLEPVYGDNFGITEIMYLIKEEPHLLDININCIEKTAR